MDNICGGNIEWISGRGVANRPTKSQRTWTRQDTLGVVLIVLAAELLQNAINLLGLCFEVELVTELSKGQVETQPREIEVRHVLLSRGFAQRVPVPVLLCQTQ